MQDKPAQYLEKAERTPSAGRLPTPGLSGLPTDLLQEGARRLGLACIVYFLLYFFAFYGSGFVRWLITGEPIDYMTPVRVIPSLVGMGLALGLFILTRLWKDRPALLLDLGLVFLVVGALGIAVNNVYGAFEVWDLAALEKIGFIGIPWECVWIILFPIMAPNSPGKTLLASLLAASMPLLVVLVSKSTGATSAEAPWAFFLNYYLFTTFLCAIVAFFMSRLMMRYGSRLKRAREVGQYQMEELLGKGGMGEVWRARHRMLARPAAIKLIRPESLGVDEAARQSLLKRFEREARATAALGSVHTIDVFDFGITDEGQFYYVMELLDGLDMESFVKRFGPVPPGRVIHWLKQVCHSLQDAHEHGMIHRDIKPANLYVCRLGPDLDFVKVLDFGLVKTGEEGGVDATKLTQEGIAFGTPGYMAPEMAMGTGDVDGRVDVYSLGCVAYWLLTGRAVFKGDTPIATVLHHLKTEPTPPSQCSETLIPGDLEQIVLNCLAKIPDRRPENAQALLELLAACEESAEWKPEVLPGWWETHIPLN